MNVSLILAFIATAILILGFILIKKKHSHKKKFNNRPRTSGEDLEEIYDDTEDEDDKEEDEEEPENGYETVKTDIVRAGDEVFKTFVPIEQLFKEVGIVDVQDGLIEYDEEDGDRTFCGVAEMEQSNPYLKTDREISVEDAENQLFLAGLSDHTKISLQWNVTDMHAYFNKMRKRVTENKEQNPKLKKLAYDLIDDAENFEHSGKRFENHIYVQFIVKVKDTDIREADDVEEVNKTVHEVANRKVMNDIGTANEVLRPRQHELTRLYNIDLLELIYKTFNRRTSRLIPFDKIIRDQKFSYMVTASESDEKVAKVNQMAQVESQISSFMKNDPQAREMRETLERQFAEYEKYRDQNKKEIQKDLQERNMNRLKQDISNSNETKSKESEVEE